MSATVTALGGLSIIDALDDPDLFAPHFKGTSWRAWRAFLAALFGLPLSDDAAALYRAQTGRETLPLAAFVEAALIVGRRGGKSRVLALIAVFLATLRTYDEYLAPGEVATVAVIAANRSQARSIFRFVSGLLNAVPLLKALIEDETGDAITLTSRVVIEITTASFRTTRGYAFAAVLADEIAFWRSDETSANPDIEILRALRPGMASIPGSMLLLASSPYAKKGALYAAYRRHYGKDGARVLVWKADTATMNPRIDPAIIAEAYEDDPEAARAEYGAEFRDDLADFITREAIDAVTMWGRHELPPEPGVAYRAFADPSGGANDAFTLAIAHLRDNAVGVVDVVLEIRPPFDPDVAVAECAAVLDRFGIKRVIGDHYAGLWPVSRFAAHGITFEQSAKPKSDIYHDALPLFNSKRVELLEHQRLSAQLVGLERRTARSGKDSIDHTPGGHDDIANAVCGVLVGLELDRRPALVRPDDLLKDNAALRFPPIGCRGLSAAVAVSRAGIAAVVYVGMIYDGSIVVLDYDAGPIRGALFAGITERLAQLTEATRAPFFGGLWVQPDFVRQAYVADVAAEPVPDHLVDADLLLLPAAGHIASGRVKLCEPAFEKAKTSPFGGALDFRGGDGGDDPLRRAALWAIALGLDPQ